MLSRYAGHSVACLATAAVAVTGSANVRVQFLTETQMISRAGNRLRIRIQTRQIVRNCGDVSLVAECRMCGDNLHCRIFTCPGAEQGQLLFQVTLLLAGQARNCTIRRAPRARLMANHARRVQTASTRF